MRRTSTPELRSILDAIPDTREIVLLRATLDDPNVIVWREAAEMARCTYSYWRRVGGADAYTVYRAAQDRGDAAQDALAAIG